MLINKNIQIKHKDHWFGPSGDPRAAGIGSPVKFKKFTNKFTLIYKLNVFKIFFF